MNKRETAGAAGRTNTLPVKSTAEVVVESIIASGIDTLYCLPGVQNDPLFDVLWHNQNKLRVIHSRHEQGAAYMAMGAALATGKPQACCLVPGVGFLNAAAALATAYSTNAPVLTLLAHIPLNQIGRGYGALHEVVDQTPILRTMTKYAVRIDTPADAPHMMQAALTELASGRPRPVGVEVPTDVWANKAPVPALAAAEPRQAPIDWTLIEQAADILAKAERPLIIVAGGAQGAAREIRELAERLQAPVSASRNGHGVMDARHPLSVPTPVAHQLWAKADVVLAIGTRMPAPLRVWGTDSKLKIIRIDADYEEMNRIARPDARHRRRRPGQCCCAARGAAEGAEVARDDERACRHEGEVRCRCEPRAAGTDRLDQGAAHRTARGRRAGRGDDADRLRLALRVSGL